MVRLVLLVWVWCSCRRLDLHILYLYIVVTVLQDEAGELWHGVIYRIVIYVPMLCFPLVPQGVLLLAPQPI